MKYILLLILFISSMLACQDPVENAELPECASELFDLFKSENQSCEGALVAIYSFQGEEVSVFAQGNCISDGSTSVFDAECFEICFLGGIAGFSDCNDVNFYDNATLVNVIWER